MVQGHQQHSDEYKITYDVTQPSVSNNDSDFFYQTILFKQAEEILYDIQPLWIWINCGEWLAAPTSSNWC